MNKIIVFFSIVGKEFAPQLPPEGGTFYTHDAADLSRPYYKLSWPPLLQAAALWLGHYGADGKTEVFEPDNVYSNHFFLVFGNFSFFLAPFQSGSVVPTFQLSLCTCIT